jgi:hypothetical protein
VTVELVVDVCAVDYYMYLPMVFVPDANAQAAPEGQAGLPVNGLLLLPAMVGLGLVPYLRSRHQS